MFTEGKIISMKKGIPWCIISGASILLLARCFFSFSWSDESFYLAVVHRLWRGERIIADEWFTSQLSMPLLLPFYTLYQKITGGNDGVYLYFRIVYWCIATLTAFFSFYILKKKNSLESSTMCSLLYLFYARANIGGMSYYNITLTCILGAILIIYEQLPYKGSGGIRLYLTGSLLALAAICTPYLVLVYLILGCTVLINKEMRVYKRVLLKICVGGIVVVLMYLIYILSTVSVQELMLNIPYILNEPELQKTNPLLVIPLIIVRIIWRYKWTSLGMILSFGFVGFKNRKESLSERDKHLVIVINLCIFIVNTYLSWGMIGCINIAGTIFGLLILRVLEDKENVDRGIAVIFGVAGVGTCIAFSFSSDTGLDAMTIGFVILGMGIILLLYKQQSIKKLRKFITCVMILETMILRIFSVYRDAPINELNTPIKSGPAKYMLTTKEHVMQYDSLRAAILQYVRSEDIVFYTKNCFWGYLCTDNEYGTPSSWRIAFDSPRLAEYYKLNPEKIPTCIFVLNPMYGNYQSSLIQGNEKVDRPNENIIGGYLAEYIVEHEYEKIELDCATIYRRQ